MLSYMSISVSVTAAMGIHWLRNDTHIADARLFDCVHHGGEGAKRDIFIGAQIDRLVLRITNLLPQARSDLVDVDGIVPEKNFLRFVDADYEALFGNLFHGAGVGNVNFDSGLQYRRGHHENNKQHEDDIHKRCDVDIGKRGLGASVGGGEGHQRRTSASGGGYQSFRNSGSNRPQSRRTSCTESVECIDNSPDGSEQSNKRRNRARNRQPWDITFEAGDFL